MSASFKRALFCAGGIFSLAFLASGSARAVEGINPQKAADALVKEALHAEIYGLTSDRERLLDEARQLAPTYAPVLWNSGQVRWRTQWLKPEDTAARVAADQALNEYRRIRDNYPQTIDGQLTLANWCNKKSLAAQERAHLTRVLDMNPDHGEARQRLGFQRIDGVWMTESEVKQARARGAAAVKALTYWQPKLEAIRKQLNPQSSEAQRKTGLARLEEITDPEAIPAMEIAFANANSDALIPMLNCLDRMSDDQAALALARQAIFAQEQFVRLAAVRLLKKRSADAFVPALLSTMYTPVQSRTEIYNGPGGRLMHRQSFLREGQDNRELAVLETAYRRDALPGGNGQETLDRAMANARLTEAQRNVQAAQQNMITGAINERICAVLSITQDVSLSPQPQAWWQWWNDTNEVFVTGDKSVRQIYQSRQVTVQDRETATFSGGPSSGTPSRAVSDCFAAGTPVWTLHGPVAIEKVKVGDLVLSQDVESGEVEYQPVLRTTVRPAGKLVRATIGAESFQMSGGHLLWVAGEGWTKARNLKSGATLHALGGTVQTSIVEEGTTAETFNLIVADNNTYFVGQAKLLSHDNTIKRRTTAIVPGLTSANK